MIWISTKLKMKRVKKNKCQYLPRNMLLPKNRLNKLQRNMLNQLLKNNPNPRNSPNLLLRQQLQSPLKVLQSPQKLKLPRKLLRIGMMMKMKD